MVPGADPVTDDSARGGSGKRMQKEYYYPTQIYFTDLPAGEQINRQILPHIYAWREQDPQGVVRTNTPQVGAWHSHTEMHTRKEYNLLTAEIFEFVYGVYHDLGYDPAFEPVCDSMWVNINPRYSHNRHHTHPHALWSGVYYVQTPANCGLIYFTDPRPQAQVLTPYYDPDRRKMETWNEVYFQPQSGRIIVFPAWLDHAVQPNLSEETGQAADRISVSFNFYQRRVGVQSNNPHRQEIVRQDLEQDVGQNTNKDSDSDS